MTGAVCGRSRCRSGRLLRVFLVVGVVAAVLAFVASGTALAQSFVDVGPDDWFTAPVEELTAAGIIQGYPDGTFRPHGMVLERDFAGVLDRLIVACPSMTKSDFKVTDPLKPMTRLRAVTVIIRSAADKAAVEAITDPKAALSQCSDRDKIPAWGLKHAAYAVNRGYLSSESQFRPNDCITRSEFAGILARCLAAETPPSSRPGAGYTGLVVDCRGAGAKRCMSPCIVSEDGTRVYPDLGHLPPINFLEDRGLVSYVTDAAKSTRAGERPLEVKALRVDGAGKQMVVVSDADRDTILAAEKEGQFLANWNVVLVVDPK